MYIYTYMYIYVFLYTYIYVYPKETGRRLAEKRTALERPMDESDEKLQDLMKNFGVDMYEYEYTYIYI
jgi:hypothetical protein